MNGLLECQLSKRSSSPAAELDLNAGAGTGPTLHLDGLPPVPGSGGGSLRVAVAQVRLMERRVSSSRPSSRPGTPTSNASTETPTPSEPNDADEELLDPEEDTPVSETDGATGGPRLKRPFELLIAAAMEQNPTQFQLPNELTCTTALPGEDSSITWRSQHIAKSSLQFTRTAISRHIPIQMAPVQCTTCNHTFSVNASDMWHHCNLMAVMNWLTTLWHNSTGSSKRRRKEEMTGKNVKRLHHELDHNGLVPLPVRLCYTCGR